VVSPSGVRPERVEAVEGRPSVVGRGGRCVGGPRRREERGVTHRFARKGGLVVCAVATGALALSACGAAKTTTSTAKNSKTAVSSSSPSGTLVQDTCSGSLFVRNFNPWSPTAVYPMPEGYIYEPLYFFNPADPSHPQPWLATSYSWSDGGRSITFDLRHGVEFSNGTPFTSKDVAYTFNLEKTTPSLNTYSLPYKSITTSGPYSVTLTFTHPVYEDLPYIAGDTYIVDAAQWSKVKDPKTYLDPDPIGTGPYELKSFSAEAMTLTANPHYYMKGLPHFKEMRFLAFTSNTTSDEALETGEVDWASCYIPGINKAYTSRSSNYKVVSVPLAIAFLEANNVKGPTKSLAVREAISYGIDRSFISKAVYGGYAPPTNPEMLITPEFSSDMAPSLAGAKLTYDPAKAVSILEKAGYKKGSNGIFVSPSGKPLDITLQVQSSFTDYVSVAQIIARELKKVGINIQIQAISGSEWGNNNDTGNFELNINNAGYTTSLYSYYYDLLDSSLTAPIGKVATGDAVRFDNSNVDSWLTTAAGLSDHAARVPYFQKIEKVVAAQLPYIPLFGQQDETEFNAAVVTNYPTESNLYAMPTEWLSGNSGWVAARLRPVS